MPVMPITVAMHTDVELRGSRASSFIPALKSFEGGMRDCKRDMLICKIFIFMQCLYNHSGIGVVQPMAALCLKGWVHATNKCLFFFLN